MHKEMMINAYKKLFGVTDDAQAEEGIERHLSRIRLIGQRAQWSADEEYSQEDLFIGGYSNFCEEQLKIVWTKNLIQRLNGRELDRNTAQVTDDFGEYIAGLNEIIKERGIAENPPTPDYIFENGGLHDARNELGEIEEGWLSKWKTDVLNKVPSTKTGVVKFSFYGRNPETDRKPSVKEALGRARAEVAAACESVNGDNAEGKCFKAVIALRAVEEKHAERSGFWKFFHPINNYREKKAIRQLREQVRGSFSEEQIAAAQVKTDGEAAWIVAEKGDSILPSRLNEMKANPFETEAETRRRMEEEIAQTEKEKDELGMIAADLKEEDDFLAEEKHRENFGDTFEEALEEEADVYKSSEKESDFAEDLTSEEKEALFVSEADDGAQEEKSDPIAESDGISAPQIGQK